MRSTEVLSGAPIAEYRPQRLARGTLVIVGDAAYVVSPMTGRGYLTGVEDAALLAQRSAQEPIAAVLARYEQERLSFVRRLVAHSTQINADYRRYPAAG